MFSRLLLVALSAVLYANGEKHIVFVVDDTGSMSREIAAVKLWIENCASGQDPANCAGIDKFVLSTFNDPGTGDVIGPTDSKTILEAVKKIKASGGGDCPELMGAGLENALKAFSKEFKPGECKVFGFTDATAKDEDKLREMFDIKNSKGCSINLILTGCCGKCPSMCDSEAVEEGYCRNVDVVPSGKRKRRSVDLSKLSGAYLYYALARKTGGSVYVIDKPRSPQDMLDFMKKNVTIGFCPSDKIAGPATTGYLCEADCVKFGMCWDKTLSKCFCSSKKCQHKRPRKSKCPGHSVSKCSKGKRKEYLPDPYDCQTFYLCMKGKRMTFSCPKGKVFTGRGDISCDYPKNVVGRCGTSDY